jgi:hypothetical protein
MSGCGLRRLAWTDFARGPIGAKLQGHNPQTQSCQHNLVVI